MRPATVGRRFRPTLRHDRGDHGPNFGEEFAHLLHHRFVDRAAFFLCRFIALAQKRFAKCRLLIGSQTVNKPFEKFFIDHVSASVRLPEFYWECTVVGRRADSIAEELGISVNAVYLAKGRVLRRLRQELDGMF